MCKRTGVVHRRVVEMRRSATGAARRVPWLQRSQGRFTRTGSRRVSRHRRLRPHPVEIARYESRASGRRTRCRGRCAAASVHQTGIAVRRVLRLHERRQHGDCRRRLPAGEAPIPASTATLWSRACAPAPSQCGAVVLTASLAEWCMPSPGQAISWFVSVPVRSRNGPPALPAELTALQASARRGGVA